jgi:hypothetical protein
MLPQLTFRIHARRSGAGLLVGGEGLLDLEHVILPCLWNALHPKGFGALNHAA